MAQMKWITLTSGGSTARTAPTKPAVACSGAFRRGHEVDMKHAETVNSIAALWEMLVSQFKVEG